MTIFFCFAGCVAAGPRPPIELPFAVHKAGTIVSTELRIPEKGPFVYQFMLKFMHKDSDKADRARVQQLLGSSRHTSYGIFVEPGVQTPLKITLSVIDSSGEHIFLEKEFSTVGISASGENYFKRQIDLSELKRSPGLYRVTVQSLKDIPELADTKVFFTIYYPT
jgi:hypothetical protein